jgi:predicted nucleic acid-binding protein
VRVVLDTNVLARAHQLARGPAREVLLRVVDGQHVLVLSTDLLREVARGLAYPRLLRRSRLTATDITDYLEFLARAAALVQPAAIPPGVIPGFERRINLGHGIGG